ncbi:MAG TPA: trypsin-like peptidase domain-containing protein [Saprospiraceae bacterium]|nr:trypsin-like peptidase domain-containing protein [Saprospiraceae bacterium]HPI06227.1 trypsin-like peptidase domain-containing protein [Saprospiraceae bacterium]
MKYLIYLLQGGWMLTLMWPRFSNQHTADVFTTSDSRIERAMRSTVQITAFSASEKICGAGALVTPDGLILTSYHNVDAALSVEVKLYGGHVIQATLVAASPEMDLALLKIDTSRLDFFQVSRRTRPEWGERLFAIGHPGCLPFSLTEGFVGGFDRRIGAIRYPGATEQFIQTDIPLNPGCSGGPLFDRAGELVGINTAIWTKSGRFEGYAFAVPVGLINKFINPGTER